MKKVKMLKGFVIAAHKDGTFFQVYTKDEWACGSGLRYAEFSCNSLQECIDNINSY